MPTLPETVTPGGNGNWFEIIVIFGSVIFADKAPSAINKNFVISLPGPSPADGVPSTMAPVVILINFIFHFYL